MSYKNTRRWQINEKRLVGMTFQKIADHFGLTNQRIHQIFSDYKPAYYKYRKDYCESCGGQERYTPLLHVHHLDHNHSNNKPNNLVTLCSQCHGHIHALQRNVNPIRKAVDWDGYIRERRIRAYKAQYPDKKYPF